MSTQPYALYNPAMLAPEQLLAEFTARQSTLDRLVDVVRNNQPGHPNTPSSAGREAWEKPPFSGR
jgi:hypothetical protein